MTQDKHRKKAIREEARLRGLPYQTVLEERWRPYDAGPLRDRLRSEAARFCATQLPRWSTGDTERLDALIEKLLPIAVAPKIYRYFGHARQEVRDGEIGPEKADACMRLVADFVLNREPQPDDYEKVIAQLTRVLALVVCRRCPGHHEATELEAVEERTNIWLFAEDGDWEKLTDDD